VTATWGSHDLLLLLPLLQSDGEREEGRQHGIQVSAMAIWKQPEIKQANSPFSFNAWVRINTFPLCSVM